VAIDSNAPRSRRAILAGALGGAGALLAHSLGRATPVRAADGDPLELGAANNAASLPTVLTSTASPGLSVITDAGVTGRTALEGTSATGMGVVGISNGPFDPSTGRSAGVVGLAGGGGALLPDQNIDETGVYGAADVSLASAGVWGDSSQGIGVVGTGDWGVYGFGANAGSVGVVGDAGGTSTAVYGFAGEEQPAAPASGTGVMGRAGVGASYGVVAAAAASNQFALYVAGRLRLNGAGGRTTFGSTATSKKILLAGVSTSSFVVATIQTSIAGCYVRAVVPAAGSFTIYLSKAPGKTAVVGYIVAN
jgi:hypothetical protein